MFFRKNTKEKAHEFGLDGWVRNRDDGRVEAVFEGAEEDIERILEFCREGPRLAQVEDVAVSFEEPEGVEGFSIRR